jgi:hypothetical protein
MSTPERMWIHRIDVDDLAVEPRQEAMHDYIAVVRARNFAFLSHEDARSLIADLGLVECEPGVFVIDGAQEEGR